MEKKLNLRQLLVTALLTALVTILVTVPIYRIVERSKPRINISNINFSNDPDAIVEVGDELLLLEPLIRTFSNIPKYSKYSSLRESERQISEMISELEYCVDVIKQWISQNKNETVLDYQTLSTIPILQFSRLQEAMIEMLYLYNFEPRSTESSTDTQEIVLPFFIENNYIGFKFRDHDEIFVNLLTYNVADQDAVYQLFQSIIRGDAQQILEYHQMFIDNASDYLYKLQKYRNELKKTILVSSRLEAEITVFNKGKSGAIIFPYFVFWFLDEKYANNRYTFEVSDIRGDADEALENYTDRFISEFLSLLTSPEMMALNLSDENKFSFPEVDSVAENTNRQLYIALEPGDTKTIVMRSTKTIGNFGEELYDVYLTGIASCRIEGLTVENKRIRSKVTSFGLQNEEVIVEELGRGN